MFHCSALFQYLLKSYKSKPMTCSILGGTFLKKKPNLYSSSVLAKLLTAPVLISNCNLQSPEGTQTLKMQILHGHNNTSVQQDTFPSTDLLPHRWDSFTPVTSAGTRSVCIDCDVFRSLLHRRNRINILSSITYLNTRLR